jgi:nucleoside-diphosphate-sugar epimerase
MRILITGGNGFLGKSLVKYLQSCGIYEIFSPRSRNFDLTNPKQTKDLFDYFRPNKVVHLAAVVGGIGANKENPGSFFYKNCMMGLNVIENCRIYNIEKVVQIGTVCSYPKFTPVPFNEGDMWNGYPEETNAPYGIAKKALYTMIRAYADQYNLNGSVLVPCNLYGPNDNFDPGSSHVIPALIKKFVEAKTNKDKSVVCWGTGNATREFLYVDDASKAISKSLEIDTGPDPINLGGGSEIKIKDLAEKIGSFVGYDGTIEWDSSKPDGQPRRFLDISRAKEILNWVPSVTFDHGLKNTIEWYLNNK